jgi:hypothetical protein
LRFSGLQLHMVTRMGSSPSCRGGGKIPVSRHASQPCKAPGAIMKLWALSSRLQPSNAGKDLLVSSTSSCSNGKPEASGFPWRRYSTGLVFVLLPPAVELSPLVAGRQTGRQAHRHAGRHVSRPVTQKPTPAWHQQTRNAPLLMRTRPMRTLTRLCWTTRARNCSHTARGSRGAQRACALHPARTRVCGDLGVR